MVIFIVLASIIAGFIAGIIFTLATSFEELFGGPRGFTLFLFYLLLLFFLLIAVYWIRR